MSIFARRSFFIGAAAMLFPPKVEALPPLVAIGAAPRFLVSLRNSAGEADFMGYARQSGRLFESGGGIPDAIDFPACTGGACIITHFGIHTIRGDMILDGPMSPNIYMGNGITARLIPNIDEITAKFLVRELRKFGGTR